MFYLFARPLKRKLFSFVPSFAPSSSKMRLATWLQPASLLSLCLIMDLCPVQEGTGKRALPRVACYGVGILGSSGINRDNELVFRSVLCSGTFGKAVEPVEQPAS